MSHLSRRRFIGGAVGSGATVGLLMLGACRASVFAPLASRVAQVGYLTGTGPANLAYASQYEAFRSAMTSYGWTEGENLTITVRYANGDVARLPGLVAELLSLPLDVLVAIGTNSAVEAKHATATLPIVNIAGSDPIAQGLVASLAHPGGNLTGNTAAVSSTTPTAKQLDLLKALVPGLARVAALVNAAGSSATVGYPLLASAATSVGIDLVRLEVRSSSDFGAAFTQARDWHAQACVALVDGSLINLNARQLADLALAYALPSASTFKVPFAEAGFTMTYGPEVLPLHARGAYYVDRILRGARPADLPIEEPAQFELALNVKTVEALGLTIPPEVAAQVTEWVA